VSDVSRGPGWWLASDGKWYPPELHPAYRPPPPPLWTDARDVPPPVPPKPAAGRKRTALALSLLVGGAVCGVAGLVLFFVTGFAGLLGSTVYQAPVRAVVDCRPGDYYVYQQTGTRVSGPGLSFSHDQFPTLTPEEVSVMGPGRVSVGTWPADGSETITKGSQIFSNAVGFHASVGGEYTVTVTSPSPTAFIIGPSLGAQFVAAAPWLILPAVGWPIAIVGLVLLIVRSNRRRRTDQALAPSG
jgi:hypothetical protein